MVQVVSEGGQQVRGEAGEVRLSGGITTEAGREDQQENMQKEQDHELAKKY